MADTSKPSKGGPVIKVHFHDPVDGKNDYYFGSLKAIYSIFTPEDIGCQLQTLYHSHLTLTNRKGTDKCVISKHEVIRSKQEKKR